MARSQRGVDGWLTLLALLVALVPQATSLFHIDVSAYLSASSKADPGRYLLETLGLLYAVSVLLVALEVVISADGSRARGRWLKGLTIVMRLAQGLLGALVGIFGSLIAATLSGVPTPLQTASLWLATILLALIVALPFLYDRLGRRTPTKSATRVSAESGTAEREHALASSALPSTGTGDAVAVDVTLLATADMNASASAIEAIPAPSLPRGRRIAAQVVLLGAFGLDLLLYSLVVPFLPAEAQRLGATPLTTGILFAMYSAGLFAATPLAAWLTDRIGPRPTLLWGLVILGGGTLLFAFSPALSLGLPGLFGARAAQGIASALTWTAGLAVLAQLHTAEDRRRIFARAFTVTGLSALIGPPLGGALYTLGGFMLPFLVAAGLVALDGIGRLVFLPSNASLPATRPDSNSTRALLRAPGFQLGLFAAVAGALTLSSLEPVTPLLLGQVFGVPVLVIGAIFGALALCFVLMQPLVSRSERRLGTRPTLAIGLMLAGLSFAGIALVSSVPRGVLDLAPDLPLPLIGVAALLGVAGCALALVAIPVPELLTRSGQQLAGSGGVAYGAIYAAYNGAYSLGLLLGPLITGAAVAAQGVSQSFLFLALPSAVSALAILAWRTRDQKASEAQVAPST